jgi:hypothetical protein
VELNQVFFNYVFIGMHRFIILHFDFWFDKNGNLAFVRSNDFNGAKQEEKVYVDIQRFASNVINMITSKDFYTLGYYDNRYNNIPFINFPLEHFFSQEYLSIRRESLIIGNIKIEGNPKDFISEYIKKLRKKLFLRISSFKSVTAYNFSCEKDVNYAKETNTLRYI